MPIPFIGNDPNRVECLSYLAGAGLPPVIGGRSGFIGLFRFFQLWSIVAARIGHGRCFIKRQARDYATNLNAVQRFAFEQALSQTHHRVAIFLDDGLGAFILSRDNLLHLLVDLDGCLFGEVAMLGNLAAQEYLLLLLPNVNGPISDMPYCTNHRAREFGSAFDVV